MTPWVDFAATPSPPCLFAASPPSSGSTGEGLVSTIAPLISPSFDAFCGLFCCCLMPPWLYSAPGARRQLRQAPPLLSPALCTGRTLPSKVVGRNASSRAMRPCVYRPGVLLSSHMTLLLAGSSVCCLMPPWSNSAPRARGQLRQALPLLPPAGRGHCPKAVRLSTICTHLALFSR
jgi:hypothetical protein